MPSWTTNRAPGIRSARYLPASTGTSRVLGAVQDERRHPDERQDVPDVDLLVHPQERLEHPGLAP